MVCCVVNWITTRPCISPILAVFIFHCHAVTLYPCSMILFLALHARCIYIPYSTLYMHVTWSIIPACLQCLNSGNNHLFCCHVCELTFLLALGVSTNKLFCCLLAGISHWNASNYLKVKVMKRVRCSRFYRVLPGRCTEYNLL